jgi:signal transduction histidine kinase
MVRPDCGRRPGASTSRKHGWQKLSFLFPHQSRVSAHLAAVVLATAIPLAGAAGYLWLKAVEESRAAATESVRQAALNVAVDLRGLFRQSGWMLSQLAQQPGIREFRRDACEAEALWLRRMHPEFLNVLAWDAAGRLVCSAVPVPAAFERSAREGEMFRKRLKSEGLEVSDLFYGRIAGRQVILLSHPILDKDGDTKGVVAVALKPESIDDVLSRLPLPQGSSAAIVDRQNVVVARVPDGPKWRGASVSALPINRVPSAFDRSAGELVGLDGIVRLYAMSPLAEAGWSVYAGIPSDLLLTRHREWAFRAIAVSMLLLAACAFLTYALASRIAREFNRMLAAEQQLSARVLRAEEAERRRISRELHDQVGQELTALTLDLKQLRRQAASAAVERCLTAVDRLVDLVRDVTLALRPPQLDDLGLAAALRSHIRHFVERHGIAVHLDAEIVGVRLSPALEAACFRIVQEALTNVLRHAQAHNVWIHLRERGHELVLRLRDDGGGFDVDAALQAANARSLGLRNLLDRAQLAGGSLRIRAARGQGTELEGRFPL